MYSTIKYYFDFYDLLAFIPLYHTSLITCGGPKYILAYYKRVKIGIGLFFDLYIICVGILYSMVHVITLESERRINQSRFPFKKNFNFNYIINIKLLVYRCFSRKVVFKCS